MTKTSESNPLRLQRVERYPIYIIIRSSLKLIANVPEKHFPQYLVILLADICMTAIWSDDGGSMNFETRVCGDRVVHLQFFQ